MAMALYPYIKAMALYQNESCEEFWEESFDSGKVEITKSGKKHASYEMVNEWVMDAWKHAATNESMMVPSV